MFSYKTLSTYLFGLYCRYFTAIFVICVGVLALSNVFDVLQKFKGITLSSKFFWNFALYKIPYLLNEIAPLISFIAMLYFVNRLTKYNELVIILSSGISMQRVLIIAALAAGMLGVLVVAILNPIGTYGLQKYEYLENTLTNKKHKSFVAVQDGLLIFEEYNNKNRIISAKSVNLITKKLVGITILFVDSKNNFLKRIDAQEAILTQNNFYLNMIKVANDENIIDRKELTIPTNLSIDYFTHSLILPEMISIWNLKPSIDKFLNSGLSVINYQIYYYKQLCKPLLMISTVILASCFVSLNQKNHSQKIVYGMLLGFVVYSLIEITSRILAYSGLQPAFAIMLPIFLLMLISNFVVLHLHEA